MLKMFGFFKQHYFLLSNTYKPFLHIIVFLSKCFGTYTKQILFILDFFNSIIYFTQTLINHFFINICISVGMF